MVGSRRRAALVGSLVTSAAVGLSTLGLSALAVASTAAPPDRVATVTADAAAFAAAAPKKNAKGLRVRVLKATSVGRNQKVRLKVTVTGPRQNGKKFRHVIRKTRTWPKVRPGVYRIKAAPVRMFERRVVPSVSATKVRIRKDRARRTVKVTYGNPVFCAGPGYRVRAWGDNTHGQLGSRKPALSSNVERNRFIGGLTAVTGGRGTAYALCNDGTVWAWGLNSSYQLGVGDTRSRHYPVRVTNLSNVTEIAAGADTGYALTSTGQVWAWGQGRHGELGNRRSGLGTTATMPVLVQLPGTFVHIAAGGRSAYAVRDDGRVYAWGAGGVGQRGDGTTGESTPRPVQVSGLTDVVEIAAGQVTAYARTGGGTMYGWGGSNQGEIPNVAPWTSTPAVIATGVSKIGASRSAGFFMTSTLHGFGSGRHHDTGRDTGGSPTTPDQVPGPSGPFSSVVQLAGAGHTSYVLDADGNVFSWGDNERGQAGVRPLTGPAATQGVLPVLMRTPGCCDAPAVAIGAGHVNGYLLLDPNDITR